MRIQGAYAWVVGFTMNLPKICRNRYPLVNVYMSRTGQIQKKWEHQLFRWPCSILFNSKLSQKFASWVHGSNDSHPTTQLQLLRPGPGRQETSLTLQHFEAGLLIRTWSASDSRDAMFQICPNLSLGINGLKVS